MSEIEQQTINQRINLLVDYFEKGRKASFARATGISPQGLQELLTGRQGDPSFKVLVKIIEAYPQVQINWLVLGQGEMFKASIETEGTNGSEFILTLEADVEVTGKRIAYWQGQINTWLTHQDAIDAELNFLRGLSEEDESKSELFRRSSLFAEAASKQNKSNIDGAEGAIHRAHERLAVLHQKIAELMRKKLKALTA